MASLSFNEKILSSKAIICDIEGTTTSISFVKVGLHCTIKINIPTKKKK